MNTRRARPLLLLLAVSGLVVGMLATVAEGHIGAPVSGVIHSCVEEDGELRVIGESEDCEDEDESPIDWNIQGDPGPAGSPGPAGPPGPSGWALTGNAGTNPATDFVGTTDNQPLVLRANSAEAMRLLPDGHVVVASTPPDSTFLRGPGANLTVADTSDIVQVYVDVEDPAGRSLLQLGVRDPSQSGVFQQGNALVLDVYGTNPTNLPPGTTVAGTPISNSAFVRGVRGNSGSLQHFAIVAGTGADLRFASNRTQQMIIDTSGNVGIGTTTPTDKLEVSGGNIRVTGGGFIDDGTTLNVPDFVFTKNYPLRSLADVQQFIDQHGHLPGVPSAGAIAAEGVNLGEFQMLLLQKIEELTLYLLQQQALIDELHQALAAASR